MLVDVSQVKRSPGRTQLLQLSVEPHSPLQWEGEALYFAQPYHIELTMESQKEGSIFVQGNLQTAVKTVCSRCLQPVEYPLETAFKGYYHLKGKFPGNNEEFPGQFYSGDTLELDGLIRESIYLALPMQFLCSEECRGLCPFCGNRIDEGCNCKHEEVDPRLEVLKQLLQDKN